MHRSESTQRVPPLQLRTLQRLLPTRSSTSLPYSRLKRSVLQELRPVLQKEGCVSTRGFIPFVNERDGLGRLIAMPGVTEVAMVSTTRNSDTRRSLLRYELNQNSKLRKKVLFPQTPANIPTIGTYSISPQWVKKSFLSRKLNSKVTSPASPAFSVPRPKFKSETEYAVLSLSPPRAKPKKRRVDSKHSPSTQDLKVKNRFGSLELQGNPEELKANLAFKVQLALRDKVLNNFKEMTRSIYRKWYGGS